MLTDLDVELFPDECDVVEIPHHNLNIYCIFKNGSSTLQQIAQQNHYRIYHNHDLYQLQCIDFLVREPRHRYVAGIDLFVKTIKRDNPSLDTPTCVWFANRYSFLNRHYLTQFHWLMNLIRFTNPDCRINFHDFNLLASITDHNDKNTRDPEDPAVISAIKSYLPQKEFWFLLDDILLGLKGHVLTWNEIKKVFRNHPAAPLKEFTTATQLYNVLR